MKRISASRELIAVINRTQEKYPYSNPSPEEMTLIKDASTNFAQFSDNIRVSCKVDHRYALATIRKEGIDSIDAILRSNGKVEVVTKLIPKGISGKLTTDRKLFANTKHLDWSHLTKGLSKLSWSSITLINGKKSHRPGIEIQTRIKRVTRGN